MRNRLLDVIGVAAIVIAVAGLLRMTRAPVEGQSQGSTGTAGTVATPGPAPSTAWGDPDLQGIWTDQYQTPLQRPPQFANKELFTDDERAALDKQRAGILRRDQRVERGSERDVAGAYNAVFQSVRPTGKRTSLIVDPPDGRIPALTPEATKRNATEREYRLALLQPTETCKKGDAACAGGKYGPVSPRRAEMPPFYNTGRTNRNDGPEDRSMAERCMAAVLPDFGGYRRIVQAPGSVSIFYDTGQGQGWQRIIPVDGSPHLPSSVRQRFGDSRGRWEGNTLVVDVTNFSPKFSFQAARENLHLVERWTRLDANTIEYSVTIEDPTTWTRPWTVKQEMSRQDEQANRIYYEPRCHEGNYGLPTMLLGTRAEERAFARGDGPDPATKDTATDFGNEGGTDALTGAGGAIF
jgi:hypothetical protein